MDRLRGHSRSGTILTNQRSSTRRRGCLHMITAANHLSFALSHLIHPFTLHTTPAAMAAPRDMFPAAATPFHMSRLQKGEGQSATPLECCAGGARADLITA